jgi:hypothetical protein
MFVWLDAKCWRWGACVGSPREEPNAHAALAVKQNNAIREREMKNVNISNKMAGAAIALGVLGFTTQASAVDSPYKGDLILNEYNAVGPEEQLEDCPSEEDIFFGCVDV